VTNICLVNVATWKPGPIALWGLSPGASDKIGLVLVMGAFK